MILPDIMIVIYNSIKKIRRCDYILITWLNSKHQGILLLFPACIILSVNAIKPQHTVSVTNHSLLHHVKIKHLLLQYTVVPYVLQ